MSTNRTGGILASLSMLADEISGEKTAAEKKAETPTPSDPGGYQGASTHPTTSVDNRGQGAAEGSRSSENTSDVKADQGKLSVDNTPENVVGSQDEVQLNIGTKAKATGEDPSTEDDFKGGKDDPGSSHAARTDNDSLDGHKYASAKPEELVKFASDLNNSILADLATGRGSELTKQAMDEAAASCGMKPSAAGENPPAQPKKQGAGLAPSGESVMGENTKAASDGDALTTIIKQAAHAMREGELKNAPIAGNVELQAGYALAEKMSMDKTAAQRAVVESVNDTINDALIDADLLGSYLWATKKAMDEDQESGEDHNAPGDDSSGASATDGASGGGEGEDPASEVPGDGGGEQGGGDPIADMLGGDGGGDLGDALGGGADPGGMMPPADPTGGMGGGMGGGGQEQAIMQLVAALDELGIPLEELAGAGGPMGGGAPPMGGGMPPEAGMPPAGGAPPMTEGMKLASVAKAFKRSGKYRFKEAANGSPERQLREQMKSHILELVSG